MSNTELSPEAEARRIAFVDARGLTDHLAEHLADTAAHFYSAAGAAEAWAQDLIETYPERHDVPGFVGGDAAAWGEIADMLNRIGVALACVRVNKPTAALNVLAANDDAEATA